MKKLLLALLTVCTIMVAPPAAHAEPATQDYYDLAGHNMADTWPNSGIESFCHDPAWENNYSAAAVDNIVTDISLGLSEWPNSSDFNRVFDHTGVCGGQASFVQAWLDARDTKALGETTQEEFCQNYLTGSASRVEYENLSSIAPNSYGMTIVCDRDNNETNDFFVVIMDPDPDWFFPQSAPNATYPNSFWAQFTHEAGHVTGWGATHFSAQSDACPNNGNHNTMCDDGYGWSYGFGGIASTTIESHDIGEINQAY